MRRGKGNNQATARARTAMAAGLANGGTGCIGPGHVGGLAFMMGLAPRMKKVSTVSFTLTGMRMRARP
jgi:hypothetical protein